MDYSENHSRRNMREDKLRTASYKVQATSLLEVRGSKPVA
jgi:hypothetical protein